jgi:hypothetical protein
MIPNKALFFITYPVFGILLLVTENRLLYHMLLLCKFSGLRHLSISWVFLASTEYARLPKTLSGERMKGKKDH